MKEQWFIHSKKADFASIGKKYNIDQVTARVIRNRDIITDTDIDNYIHSDINKLTSPWMYKDMDKAVDILKIKIASKNKIRIICDYDVDGICSGFILYSALKKVGAIVDVIAPDREKDGYGININLIDKAIKDGVDTILTCDNGIAAYDEVEYAKANGLTVIVTDHHEVPFSIVDEKIEYTIPRADAVVDHKQHDCEYPFKELCGAMVAYQLIRALYESMDMDEKKIHNYLMYAGIATVADVVDLISENRAVVKESLRMIKETKDVGLSALIEACGIKRENISSYTYGFVIGPTLNASGRISVANKAIKLLCEENESKARDMAKDLRDLNEQRKSMCEKGIEKGLKMANECDDKVLVIYIEELHESIAGIVAGRIKESVNKPTLVLTKGKGGVLKGSGRSIETYNMFEKMSEVKHLFGKFGGHSMAAGFSIKNSNLAELREELNKRCGLSDDDMALKIWIDSMLPFGYINTNLVEEIKGLDPFGKGNPTPLFAERNIRISGLKVLGKSRNVLKFNMINENNDSLEGIIFGEETMRFMQFIRENFGNTEMNKLNKNEKSNVRLNVTFNLDFNEFNGEKKIQLKLKNYQKCSMK